MNIANKAQTISANNAIIAENEQKIYEAGQQIEKQKNDADLKRVKKAIIGRGGSIDTNAGIEKVPEAIFNIPADASLSYYTDEEIAYQKIVPEGAEDYALLKQLGGMTYKSNNIIPTPSNSGSGSTGVTSHGITFTVNVDGSVTLNGQNDGVSPSVFYLHTNKITLRAGTYANGGDANITLYDETGEPGEKYLAFLKGKYTSLQKDVTGRLYIQVSSNTTVYNNFVFHPTINYGTEPKPFEPYYEGLRDTKVTNIKSVGRNYFDFEAALKHWGCTYEKDGNSYTIVNLNRRAYAKPYVFTKNAGQYTLSVGGFEADETFLNTHKIRLRLGYYDGVTFKSIKTIHFVNGDKTTTSPVNTPVNAIRFDWVGIPPDSFKISEIRINKGAVDLGFDSYSENSHYIPSEIQSLDGYGLGINDTCYNYVDFENKKFIKNVNKLVFTGEEAWDAYKWEQHERFRLIKITPRAVYYVEDKTASICNEYEYNTNVFKDSNRESGILITTSKNTNTGGYSELSALYVRDAAYTSVEAFKNHLKEQYDNGTPVTLVYKLLEPEIIDISAYFDNFIKVEGGGSIKFVNEHQNAVPSKVTYMAPLPIEGGN